MATKNFNDPSSGNDVLAGYNEASQLAPIDKPDIDKVLKGYKLKLGGRKTKTDTELYRESVGAVIAWHKQRTADAAKAAAQAKADAAKQAAQGNRGAAPGNGGGASPGSGGQGGTGQPGSYAPAYSNGGTGYRLRYPAGGAAPSMSNTSVAQRPTAPKVGTAMPKKAAPLSSTQVRQLLSSMGAPATWRPPSYALANSQTLAAWVKRARAQQKTPSVARKPARRTMPRTASSTRNTRTARVAVKRPSTTAAPVRRTAYRTITRY